MKQKNIRIIITAIEVLVILAGIVVINIMGFNKELRFSQSQSIDVYIEQEVDKDKVKSIVNDVLGSENNMVQTVEIYKDMVTIRAKEITDEQKDNIVSKLKENYEFEQTAENINIYGNKIFQKRNMESSCKNNMYANIRRIIFTCNYCNNKNSSWKIYSCSCNRNVHR